jgi:hypothetical protein
MSNSYPKNDIKKMMEEIKKVKQYAKDGGFKEELKEAEKHEADYRKLIWDLHRVEI